MSGPSNNGRGRPVDYVSLAAALLDQAHDLVPDWLPGGIQRGAEWVCGDLSGAEGESCSVNLNTGKWADFSSGEKGGDLVSLYAAIRGLSQYAAALELMKDLGLGRPEPVQTPVQALARAVGVDGAAPAVQGVEEPPADLPAPRASRTASASGSKWRPVVPVPAHAPAPRFRWGFKNKATNQWEDQELVCAWEYRFGEEHFGYVARFKRTDSQGVLQKEDIPFTWCEDTEDARRTQKWHTKSWEAPRPLYVPATFLSSTPADVPVVVVEGEKCASALFKLLGGELDVVTWPGGCKSWALANWAWLRGRTVYLWPDCDAKRVRLTSAEREAGIEQGTKPLLPEPKQPGVQAMVGIGSRLHADFGCQVLLCRIPKPGAVADGWDVADAIDEGWDAAKVRDFIRAASAFTPPDDAARAKAAAGISTPSFAGADEEEDADGWRGRLLTTPKGAISLARENFVLALDGMPERKLPGIADAQGVIAFNELTNDVVKLKTSPWGTPAGAWAEVDDLLMGEWLVRQHWLPSAPRGTLEEAVRMVAYRHRYHPVRTYLQGLKWDGHARLATWLRRACLEEDEWDDRDPLQRYLARVGTFFVQAMCARVMHPGIKFDYMLILEGQQGLRKSTLLRTLAGEFFADTGLVLGDKDSYQQLQGVWLYEIPELDAFSKADVMKIKAYVASQEDYFRASFDRRAAKYPRQLVFAGTTNEDHYLTDPTGNRRFWPVRVTRLIDIDWVAENRDQLLAEAMVRVAEGKRMYPLPEEELELFVPQQQARAVESAIESSIARYLYPPKNASGPQSDGDLVMEISLVQLLGKVGIGLEKLGPGRFHEKQAASALRRLGWVERRSSAPGRPRVYCRPDRPPASGSEESTGARQAGEHQDGGADACPF